jgi:hypothetical protein
MKIADLRSRLRRPHRSVSTVHYMFPLIAVGLSMFGATYLAGGSSYVILTPSPAYVEAGQQVEILVEAVAHTPVNAVDIEVSFPGDQLKVLGVDKGGSVITLWTNEPKIEGNRVTLQGGVYRKGFLGRHTIARITARAVNEGNADVLVRNSAFLAGDGKGTPVSINATDNKKAAVRVGTGAPNTTTTLSGKVAVAVFTDIDGDKDVDLGDIQAFMAAWRSGAKVYDFSGDGRMTFRDFAIILSDSFFK